MKPGVKQRLGVILAFQRSFWLSCRQGWTIIASTSTQADLVIGSLREANAANL